MGTIQIKRGTSSAVPSGLADGELAINLDNSKIYYGSGSTSINKFHLAELIADKATITQLTSSLVTASIIQTEGSNIFGDTIADTQTFNGHVTASGNISASGNITSSGDIFAGGNIHGDTYTIDANKTLASRHGSGHISLGNTDDKLSLNSNGQTAITGPITASGNISSSGNVLGDFIVSNGIMIGRNNGTTTLLAADTTPTEIQ